MIREWSRYPEVVVPYTDNSWTLATPSQCHDGAWAERREHTVNPEDTHVAAHGSDMVGVHIVDLAHAIRDGEERSVGSRAVYDPSDGRVHESGDETNDVFMGSTNREHIVRVVL